MATKRTKQSTTLTAASFRTPASPAHWTTADHIRHAARVVWRMQRDPKAVPGQVLPGEALAYSVHHACNLYGLQHLVSEWDGSVAGALEIAKAVDAAERKAVACRVVGR